MSRPRYLPLALLFLPLLRIAPQALAQLSPAKPLDKYVVPQPQFEAIAGEYSGERALEYVRGITQFHRIQASPGFTGARNWVMDHLKAYGISDVEVERLHSDGHTRYSTHVGQMAWTAREAALWGEGPFRERLCRFRHEPACLSELPN